jgi:alpha-ribazole phosphatase
MFRRVSAWFDRLVAATEAEAHLLIVTHEGVILQILAHVLGLGLAGCWHMRVETGSISQLALWDGFAVITKLNHTG